MSIVIFDDLKRIQRYEKLRSEKQQCQIRVIVNKTKLNFKNLEFY